MVVLAVFPAGGGVASGTAVGRKAIPPYDVGARPIPGELPDTPSWSVQGQVNGDIFATSLTSAGDVNGDGVRSWGG